MEWCGITCGSWWNRGRILVEIGWNGACGEPWVGWSRLLKAADARDGLTKSSFVVHWGTGAAMKVILAGPIIIESDEKHRI
jgi:hypothetical protein